MGEMAKAVLDHAILGALWMQAASPEEMTTRVCQWLARRLRAPWAEALAVHDGRLRRCGGIGLSVPQEGLPVGALATAAEATGPLEVSPPPWAAALGAKVGLAAPVLVNGKAWGILALYRRRPFLPFHQEVLALAVLALGQAIGRWQTGQELAEAQVRIEAIVSNPHQLV